MTARVPLPALPLLAALIVAACGASTAGSPNATTSPVPASPTSVTSGPSGAATITATECILELAPGPLASGTQELTFANESAEQAAFDLWRIDDGHTYADFEAAIAVEEQLTREGKPIAGPPAFVSERQSSGLLEPGETRTMRVTLRAGTHGIVCLRHFDHVPDDEVRVFALIGPVEAG